MSAVQGTKRVVTSTTEETTHRQFPKKFLWLLPKGAKERVWAVGMFEWEFKEDFKVVDQLTGQAYIIPKCAHPDRTYYRDEEWEDKLVVPQSSMEIVRENAMKIVKKADKDEEIELTETLEDLPFNQMTLRQYACIHTGVPNSGLKWLDDIIIKSPK